MPSCSRPRKGPEPRRRRNASCNTLNSVRATQQEGLGDEIGIWTLFQSQPSVLKCRWVMSLVACHLKAGAVSSWCWEGEPRDGYTGCSIALALSSKVFGKETLELCESMFFATRVDL